MNIERKLYIFESDLVWRIQLMIIKGQIFLCCVFLSTKPPFEFVNCVLVLLLCSQKAVVKFLY